MISSTDLHIAPAPAGEALSDDYTVSVNGRAVPVYRCRVSAMPFNQVWPGYQRPIDQTELAAFAYWDMGGPVEVEVGSTRPVQSVQIKPAARGIRPEIDGNRIRFRLASPAQITVEVNGWHHALHLFASAPQHNVPRADDPNVRYFGPGIHRTGRFTISSNQTVYLAPGAVVYGSIGAQGASNIRICGRGIIDVSELERGQGRGAIRLSDCTNARIEGVILRDPDSWCLGIFGCRDVSIDNVKLIGLWRYNSDGIDICNSQDVSVRDSFVRAFDDNIVLKGLIGRADAYESRPVRSVRVSNCVLWNDWGIALKIGTETAGPEIADAVFENCDVIRTCHVAMNIHHGEGAAIHDIRFENIRVEIDDRNPTPIFQKSRDERYDGGDGGYCPWLMSIAIKPKRDNRGTVRNITYRNISVTSKRTPTSSFAGFDEQHDVAGITIEGLRINGRLVGSAEEANLRIEPFVRDVRVAATMAP